MGRKLADRLIAVLADVWYRLDRRHREITRRNLAFAYGPGLSPEARETIARGVFRHFVRFAWELLGLLVVPLSHIRRRVVIVGGEHLDRALAQGRGAIAIAVHAGNWEYTGMGYGLQCHRAVAVARELGHPLGNRLARYLRGRGGNWMVNKQKGLKDILGHLKKNRIVCILIDQNTTTAGGLLVDFFGHPARTTQVAAVLARHRDIPVLPSFSRRLPDGRHLMVIQPPIPMRKTKDANADILQHLQEQSLAAEAWVRAEPSQWLWLHRRWKNRFPELYQGV